MSTPTRGRRRVGELKLPSTEPFFRPMISQQVAPQNKSSPALSSLSLTSSTLEPASSEDILPGSPERARVKKKLKRRRQQKTRGGREKGKGVKNKSMEMGKEQVKLAGNEKCNG